MKLVVDDLPVKLISMNSTMMCNYIKFCANQLLVTLGCHIHCKIGNLLEWVEITSVQGETKTNIFIKHIVCCRILKVRSMCGQSQPNFHP